MTSPVFAQDELLINCQIELNTKNSTRRRLTAPSGWVFGVQLGLRQTQTQINSYEINLIHHHCKSSIIHHGLIFQGDPPNIFRGDPPNIKPWWMIDDLQWWWMRLISYELICVCVCRRPSWTPKTQPNGSFAVVWLSFWCSTRFAS